MQLLLLYEEKEKRRNMAKFGSLSFDAMKQSLFQEVLLYLIIT